MTEKTRDQRREKRIKDVGLIRGKVIGHPDDFPEIRKYAEKKYKKRGVTLSHEYTPRCSCKSCSATRRKMK